MSRPKFNIKLNKRMGSSRKGMANKQVKGGMDHILDNNVLYIVENMNVAGGISFRQPLLNVQTTTEGIVSCHSLTSVDFSWNNFSGVLPYGFGSSFPKLESCSKWDHGKGF